MSDEQELLEVTGATTEVEAAAALAAQPVIEDIGPNDHRLIVAVPPGWDVQEHDLEPLQAQPDRLRGTVLVTDAASFVGAVLDRKAADLNVPSIYADSSTNRLVAVLNDDAGKKTGWRDYRVSLSLIRTPEWTHWLSKDGRLMPQEEFAEHIEDGLTELTSPPAADMLDLAQSFHATNTARFKTQRRLGSGETQFMYEEDISATAGGSGTLSIPTQIELSVMPFYGARPVFVQAWFRYRLAREALTLGYKIERSHEVEQRAFEEIRDDVKKGLPDFRCLSGPAPELRSV